MTLAEALKAETNNNIRRNELRLKNMKKFLAFIEEKQATLADSPTNFWISTMYVSEDTATMSVYSREELAFAMKLAPVWKKSNEGSAIGYSAELFAADSLYDEGVTIPFTFTIYARQDALPPTCKLEEYEEIIPAQPQKIYKRNRVVCDL